MPGAYVSLFSRASVFTVAKCSHKEESRRVGSCSGANLSVGPIGHRVGRTSRVQESYRVPKRIWPIAPLGSVPVLVDDGTVDSRVSRDWHPAHASEQIT